MLEDESLNRAIGVSQERVTGKAGDLGASSPPALNGIMLYRPSCIPPSEVPSRIHEYTGH